jgi:hypothetical protein
MARANRLMGSPEEQQQQNDYKVECSIEGYVGFEVLTAVTMKRRICGI